jgi:hypothetical protein
MAPAVMRTLPATIHQSKAGGATVVNTQVWGGYSRDGDEGRPSDETIDNGRFGYARMDAGGGLRRLVPYLLPQTLTSIC